MAKKILVIGESCTDVFVYGTTVRKSPEGKGPVLIPTSEMYYTGMAANTSNNLSVLGANVALFSQNSEIIKTRYLNDETNELYLRVDEYDTVQPIQMEYLPDLSQYDAIVISDYNKGFLTEDNIQTIASQHPTVILDTKKQLGAWCKDVKFIKLNRAESEKNLNTILQYNWLREKVISTLDKDGASYKHQLIPTKRVEVVDISGAGDTFVAGFTIEYLESEDVIKSIQFANECATKVIVQRGVATI